MTDEYAPSHVRCACLYNTHTKTAVIIIGKAAVNGNNAGSGIAVRNHVDRRETEK
jgi:hypothetical protein